MSRNCHSAWSASSSEKVSKPTAASNSSTVGNMLGLAGSGRLARTQCSQEKNRHALIAATEALEIPRA
eukprot:3642131-Pyramimonas_sp.AAC.1